LLNNCRQTLRPRRGAFGKPNPAEYKPELTVVGRDENFLYVFGKDAQLYSRAIFWSDPNSLGLVNCESWGAWDGTFMVHKLQSRETPPFLNYINVVSR
ncbi:MAG: hypothetical protein AB1465_07200, partial [Patescibacteria group bacterium]